jgi:hypothetical protein
MNHHNKHHVKKHHWYDGVLRTTEFYFNTLEEALEHANNSDAHSIKVYSPEGELLHNVTPVVGTTYA